MPHPPQPPPPAPPPKLIIAISVDQLSADLFDEYRPQFSGGLARLARGHRVPQRLSEPCRDRDLPRPFDHPHRLAAGAHRDHRQQLVRPVAAPRSDKAVYCAEDERVAGLVVDHLHRLADPPEGADAGRAAEGGQRRPAAIVAVAGKDRSAVMMGGQRRRPALVLGRQGLCHRPAGAAVPAQRRRGQRRRRRADRRAAAAARCRRRFAPPRRAPCRIEGGGKPVGDGALRARRGRCPRLPRLARRSTARRSRSPRALIDEMQLGSGPRHRHPLDRPRGDRLCRPQLWHRRAGDVPATALARPRPRRFLRAARPHAGSIMRSC